MAVMSLMMLGVGVLAVAGVYYRKRVSERKWGKHDSSDEQNVNGKIVIISGANSGLGLEASYEMVIRGATVIMACRNLAAVQEAIVEITKRRSGNEKRGQGQLIPMLLNLASLESVREFVAEFKKRYKRLDILINNAGVYVPFEKHQVTLDDFEIHMGINHLGHFLLTNLLLDYLQRGAPSRVVTLSSTLHEKGEIRLDDINLEKLTPEEKKKAKPYSDSKMANILFTRELANRMAGTGVHTYALCPGWVKTNIFRNTELKFYYYIFIIPIAFLFMRSTHQGCQTILHCALSNSCGTETGKLYRNCDIYVSPASMPEIKGKQLWELSEKLTGLTE